MNKFIIGVAIGFVFGGIIGASWMANSKVAAIADIVTEHNQEIQELKARYSAELTAAYTSVKAKAGEALASVSAEELGFTVEDEAKATLEKAGEAARDWLDSLKSPTPKEGKI